MSLEADLGIDSIKRVEILSTLRDRAPDLPDVDPATLGKLQTLGQILEALPAGIGAVAANFESAGEEPAGPLARTAVRLVPAPSSRARAPGRVALIPDRGGFASLLEGELHRLGAEVVRPGEPHSLAVFVRGVDPEDTGREAFSAAKAALAESRGFVTVSRLGGFGLPGAEHPEQAALAGLVKTAALEHPGLVARAIDLDPGLAPAEAARLLAEELLLDGPRELSIDRSGARSTLESVRRDVVADRPLPGAGAVFIVTGGARGVNAAWIEALALRCRPRIAVFGRSAIDSPEIPAVSAARDEAGVKRAIFQSAPGLGPAEVGRRAQAILAAREVRSNIAAIESTGSPVFYLPVDVTDREAVERAVARVRARFGAVTGLVHAAGVIHDRKILDKTEAQFDSVYRTKVEGLRNLLAATESDPLGWLILFSSVAGRTGNIGQSDYSMANEALNRMAAREAVRRPGCVVRSIGWGPWKGGMVTPALEKQFAAMGVALIPLEDGASRFVAELGCASPPEVVIGADLPGPALPGGEVQRRASARLTPFLRDHTVATSPGVPVALAMEWFAQAARALAPGRELAASEGR